MKYYFPIHLDGDNRGCEAIAKGTSLILGYDKSDLIGYCENVNLDRRLGIDHFVTLENVHQRTLMERIILKIYKLFVHNENKRRSLFYYQQYHRFLDMMTKDDVLISTGGDMMCYDNNQVNYTVNYANRKGYKSILWGCSIGEKNLTSEKLEALKNFTLIYARETLTQEMLANHGINNVVVYPDPAFILQPERCELPECFSNGDVVGINLSNFVMGGFSLNTEFAQEVKTLINYILKETTYKILLIPHVLWEGQDDRIICDALYEQYKNDRISVLDSDKLNYCQIRYVISHCKVFIGARTHSVISAYSACVPAIAIGYSIKSRGIAKDLGMPDWSVIDSQNINKESLLNAFIKMEKEKQNIKDILLTTMGGYKQKTLGMLDEINRIIKILYI